ncbi:hypothetical protein TNCV_2808051 [Trichonephila clavipes]|nr:hypothetical protein TNCV_2808051 [Trichonephila clavipes]
MASDSERALLLRMDGERGTEADMRRNPKKGRGGATRGGKANQDATWAEPNTNLGETGQNDERHWREQELKKKNGIGTKQAVWFTVQECIEIRLKSARGGGWLRGGRRNGHI